jgi:tetratricopeptide (TPR) repeat protein
VLVLGIAPAQGADLEEARALLRAGQYEACGRLADEELEASFRSEPWSVLKIRAELAQGRDEQAATALEEALDRNSWSLALRLLGYEVFRVQGREDEARELLDEIEGLVRAAPRRYGSAEDLVVLGRFFLLRGVDARKVLEQFYDAATRSDPELLEAYLAKAELALGKQDDALAVETLARAPRAASEEPGYHELLARAYSGSDRGRSEEEIDRALAINPNHEGSLLLRVDHLIDGERYEEAGGLLDHVLRVNPRSPRAWAYRAVLAHLDHDARGEAAAREAAFRRRAANPEVDHLIGRKLSQKYRFAEGSAYQRRALEQDPGMLPAKLQLAQDLLRLGREDEGWTLAQEVFDADGYNVVAFNLIELRDELKGYRTLRDGGFVVRMEPSEADLYGMRVLDLLKQARATLSERYGVTIDGEVTVEIFPRRDDFAVRTFGLPGADGLLGVCFGRVITALSPSAMGESPSSWESVLWHEFCHAVTLEKTRNTMPRWLSEGISMFEEGRRDPAWASPLSPHDRERLLADDLTPLSRLSAAFLGAKTGREVQFAYLESALAVEFLVDRAGLEAMRGVLDDLGGGKSLEESLPERAGMSLLQLDEQFARFARRRAEDLAPGADWEPPDLPPDSDSRSLTDWLAAHPNNVPALIQLGARLVAEGRWEEAEAALRRLQSLYPQYVGTDNPYMRLAEVHRQQARPDLERADLEALAARDADAVPALLRLVELDEAESKWDALARDARRLLGVNPLIPAPHRALAQAAEHLGRRPEAIAAYRALARLDDTDPAGLHYHLALLLRDDAQADAARREVLRALEEAPRYREAHSLLLELSGTGQPPPAPSNRDAKP